MICLHVVLINMVSMLSLFPTLYIHMKLEMSVPIMLCMCNELRGNMARSTQFPIMITLSTIIYEIVSPGAAGSSIYI